MNKHTEVVIVGGGIIGCAIAYFLRKAQVEVIVLERDTIGSHASGAAAGLVAPLGPISGPGPFADLVLAGFALFPSLVAELEDLSGVQVGFARTGALRVVRNPKRVAHLRKRLESWQPLGLQMFWLTGDEARHQEPHLAPDVCAAIYAPEEAQLDAPRLVQAFAQAAQQLGAQLYPHQEVIDLITSGTKVVGVRTRAGETLTCEHLIIASGAWAATWNTPLQVTLPVIPLRGQVIVMPQCPTPLCHIIFGEAVYLAPRGETILVGATKENSGFEVEVTEQGTSWLQTTAARLVPAITTAQIRRAWAGLRPKTADSHPILTRLPAWENVIVAAGHNSVGIILEGV
ncbi:MAG: glycine oxidase ThiO [Ktedonobacteraceae bacterium]